MVSLSFCSASSTSAPLGAARSSREHNPRQHHPLDENTICPCVFTVRQPFPDIFGSEVSPSGLIGQNSVICAFVNSALVRRMGMPVLGKHMSMRRRVEFLNKWAFGQREDVENET